MTKRRMNIGYLGDNSEHWIALSESFAANGVILPQFRSRHARTMDQHLSLTFHRKMFWRVNRAIEKILGISEPKYLMDLLKYIDENKIDCILAYWGINALDDIITLKRHRPEVIIILNVICHPTAITRSKVLIQNRLLDMTLKYIDGLVFPSVVMKNYFTKNVPGSKYIPSDVIPPCFSEDNRPRYYLDTVIDEPNIIFIGRMDWWAGQPTDNVHETISELIQQGIHVFHSDKTGNYQTNGYRHTFMPKVMSEIKDYITQFDASLIAYNLSECSSHDRFNLTIPDRLITSVMSGVPVAIPRQGYAAAKEYLREYNALIEFGSAEELLAVLSDRTRMKGLKKNARLNSRIYTCKGIYSSLMTIIRRIEMDQQSSLYR